MKSEKPNIKLKGKIILLAFLFFIIGATLEAAIPLVPITVIIARVILIISAIMFYNGFILPNAVKRFLLKEI